MSTIDRAAIIANLRVTISGRTRYEGQAARIDEILLEEIDALTAERDALAKVLEELAAAGTLVLEGLDARIDAAPSTAKPLFYGIADLHDALGHAKTALRQQERKER